MKQAIDELKRLRSILSGITGFEDDDQEYIEDARKSVDRIIEALAEQPAQQQGPKKDLMYSTVAMQERHAAFVDRAVATLEQVKREAQEQSCDSKTGESETQSNLKFAGETQAQKQEHVTDGSPCWCNPELDYKDPDTGVEVWIHKEPQ